MSLKTDNIEKVEYEVNSTEIQKSNPSEQISDNEAQEGDVPKEGIFKRLGGIFTCGAAFLSDGYQQGVMIMGHG